MEGDDKKILNGQKFNSIFKSDVIRKFHLFKMCDRR